MNKHNALASRHHYVWLAGKVGAMEGKSAAELVKRRTHNALGRRVLALDGSHTRAALGGGEVVGH